MQSLHRENIAGTLHAVKAQELRDTCCTHINEQEGQQCQQQMHMLAGLVYPPHVCKQMADATHTLAMSTALCSHSGCGWSLSSTTTCSK
jgi:hypothetical protein